MEVQRQSAVSVLPEGPGWKEHPEVKAGSVTSQRTWGRVYRLSEDMGQDLFTLRRHGTGFIVSEKMWGRIYCLSEEEQGLLSLRGYGAGSVIS